MITKTFIKKLKNQIEKTDSGRSKIIRETHGLVREAKHVIFKLHRGDTKDAKQSLQSEYKPCLHWGKYT